MLVKSVMHCISFNEYFLSETLVDKHHFFETRFAFEFKKFKLWQLWW